MKDNRKISEVHGDFDLIANTLGLNIKIVVDFVIIREIEFEMRTKINELLSVIR